MDVWFFHHYKKNTNKISGQCVLNYLIACIHGYELNISSSFVFKQIHTHTLIKVCQDFILVASLYVVMVLSLITKN